MESLLGQGATLLTGSATPPGKPTIHYKNLAFGLDIGDATCAAATTWNSADPRQFSWYSGEIRCASYNHYYGPNSLNYDCVANAPAALGFIASGWKTARSYHPGGVNLQLCDGSARFVSQTIDMTVWRGLVNRNAY